MVVLIVLIDLLGFSLVMPLLGFFGDRFKLEGWQVGLLFAAFPICQLVAGPILGRLSDRHGRRPILVLSQAGTALSCADGFHYGGWSGDHVAAGEQPVQRGLTGDPMRFQVAVGFDRDIKPLEQLFGVERLSDSGDDRIDIDRLELAFQRNRGTSAGGIGFAQLHEL